MPLDINCFKIDADINSACDPIKIGDYKQVGVMFPYEDLDRASLSIVDCVADFELLVPSAIRIYDTSFVPFKGSEVTEENKERFKEYMDTVMIPLFNMTPENAYVYTKLALGGQRWVVILGIEEGTEAEQNLFQVFGITSGLYVKSKTVDKANQAYLSVTMSQMNSQYPAVFFYDTDKATTEAKIDSWLDYDLIYGGTVDGNYSLLNFQVDVDKIGYLKFPNGEVRSTPYTSSYLGVSGLMTYYVPKNSVLCNLNVNDLIGEITTNRDKEISIASCLKITKITAPVCNGIVTTDCSSLTELIGTKFNYCLSSGCALTAKSIGNILYSAYADDRAEVTYDFSGIQNASYYDVDVYLQDTYNVSYATVYALLVTANGGTIALNDYDVITGGQIANTKTYEIRLLDDTQKGYIKLPNGTLVETVDGVVSGNYSGVAGDITFYTEKTAATVQLSGFGTSHAGYTGTLEISCTGNVVLDGADLLTGVHANNSDFVSVSDCTVLSDLQAQSALEVYATNCAIGVTHMGYLLSQLVAGLQDDGVLAVAGGTNANYDDLGLEAQALVQTLITRGWTVTMDNLV